MTDRERYVKEHLGCRWDRATEIVAIADAYNRVLQVGDFLPVIVNLLEQANLHHEIYGFAGEGE